MEKLDYYEYGYMMMQVMMQVNFDSKPNNY